ncbi:hypothetical protein ACPWSR_12690 [Alloiococcus sp. CFN-8]|uniref:hypothetical protein n=1 Tax=Alloiococcus sp. CFN-8 TaxID=3416081 RepID=UPI003CEA6C69
MNKSTDKNGRGTMKKIYILGAIVGFLTFSLSMQLVEFSSMFVMLGIWGFIYSFGKLLSSK